MLEHTFVHLPRIGDSAERAFWSQGIRTWGDALRPASALPFRARRRLEGLQPAIAESLERLRAGDAGYFQRVLPGGEHWRLLPSFGQRVVALDIETTGLRGYGAITLIGLHDGHEYRAFVRGHNLGRFPEEIRHYSLVLTYNGASFDLPFIQSEFGAVFEGLAHLDLRYPTRRLGYSGGLKSVERQTGLGRPSDLDGLDGYDAVLLWEEYRRKRPGALETLVRYNAEDVATLLPLAAFIYNRTVAGLPIEVAPFPAPERPLLDLPYDRALVRRLKAQRAIPPVAASPLPSL